VWQGVQDCRTSAWACQSCQRAKFFRYTVTPLGDFKPPAARFLNVHVVLVGTLPTSAGYTYCLTAVDRYTRWPEVVPIPGITANTVARTLMTGWISRFGCPQTITSDQGRQFESHLFRSLAKLCSIQLSRTAAYHTTANGLERFHRTLKAAIMCHADQHWTEALSLVLLGIRTAFNADLQASVAELVYGEPLRIPGELLTPTADLVEPAHLITQLRQHMARLRPIPAACHNDLRKCTHVFLCQDTTRQALQPPYSGPYQVPSQKEKTLQLLVRRRPVTVSTDRVKPTYVLNGTDRGNTTFDATPAVAPPTMSPSPAAQTTCSDRHVRFPAIFNIWATISAGGVMWEPTTTLANQRRPQQRQGPLGRSSLATANKDVDLRCAT
jgi:cleavage and polyadenylation specificity factor subunit 1